jgi:hypothetical protein
VFAQKQPLGYWEHFRPPYCIRDVLGICGFQFVVAIVRDPRDVLVSVHPSRPNGYWANTLALKRALRDIAESRDNDRVHVLFYENLVRDPETEMQDIAAFIGVDYSPDCIHIEKLGTKMRLAKAMGGLRAVSVNSIGSWHDAKHAKRLADDYDSELQELAARFGYHTGKGDPNATKNPLAVRA